MPFTFDDDLRLSIRMGLSKGLQQIRGMRRQLDEEQRDRVAQVILDHLRLANWKIERGPALGGHSQLAGGAASQDPDSSCDRSGNARS